MAIMYELNSLKDVCISLFYDYMADTVEGNKPLTHADKKYFENCAEILSLEEKIKDLKQQGITDNFIRCYQEQVQVLTSLNKSKQEKIHRDNNTFDYSTVVNIPLTYRLDKTHLPLPSLEFELEVVFYDDVTTLSGKREEFKTIRTFKNRRKFLEQNTEITHISIILRDGQKFLALLSVMGGIDEKALKEAGIVQLDETFLRLKNKTVDDILRVSEGRDTSARDKLLELYFRQIIKA